MKENNINNDSNNKSSECKKNSNTKNQEKLKECKIGFVKRLIISIKDFDKYPMIGAEGIGKALIYLLELLLIFSIIVSLAMTIKANIIIKDTCNYVEENIPDFSIQNDEFQIESENPIIIENNEYINIKLILDTNATDNQYNDEIEKYDGNIIVFLKDKAIIKSGNSATISESYKELNEQYGITDINKQNLIDKFTGNDSYKTYLNIYLSIIIIMFISYALSTIIDVLALSIVGLIITKMVRLPLKYSAVLGMSTSAVTLPIIISMIYLIINIFTGFTINYFQVMYTIISYIYIITAILIIRAEIIKKKKIINETIKIQKDIENNVKNENNIDDKNINTNINKK